MSDTKYGRDKSNTTQTEGKGGETFEETSQSFEALWERSIQQEKNLKELISGAKWVVGAVLGFFVATIISLTISHIELWKTNSEYREAHQNYYEKLLEVKNELNELKLKISI